MACLDSFSIAITGRDLECKIRIKSSEQQSDAAAIASTGGTVSKEFGVDGLIDQASGDTLSQIVTTAVTAVYYVGSPARTVFASSWTKMRTGSGTAKDLGSISFVPTAPDVSGGSTDLKTVIVSVGLPVYSQAEADALGASGSDNYTVTIYIRKSDEAIGGNPDNLDPPNP